jgi:RNA polymerase sigma-70 factor, ECF subfamily
VSGKSAVIALTEKIPGSTASPALALAEATADAPRASSGVGSGVGDIIAREYAAVWRFLRRLGVSASEVDDTAQRVFARVLGQRERIQPGSERAYLMRAAFRAALEQQRAKKRWLSRATEVDSDDTSSSWPAPDQSLAQRQELERLDRALTQLPPDMRAVFTLFELEQLTFTEISLALQLPRGTVASRVRRARERFTQALRRLEAGGSR